MLSARRRLAAMRTTGSDAGITLAELLVTMTLMSIVSALALSWLVGENSTDTRTQNASFATSDAQTVLQSWPALLQVADAPWNGRTALPASGAPTPSPTATGAAGDSSGRFLAITSTSITFNANVGNAPATTCGDACARTDTTQVTLALSAGALTQSLVKGTGTPNAITLVRSGAALVRSCLFTAYDVQGRWLGCSSTVPLGAIAKVVLEFSVAPAQGAPVQAFRTSVSVTGTFAAVPTASTPATAGA